MRIIGGKFKSKRLHAPKGDETRPSTDFAREAIFNLIYARVDLEGATVLDLFSGTGALAFEAISRGAARGILVDDNSDAVKIAARNAELLEVQNQVRIQRMDAVQFIKSYTGAPFEIILADPPYDHPDIPALPDLMLAHIADDGVVVLEHDLRNSFDDHPALDTSRSYGRTRVSVFMKPLPEDSDE